MRVQAREISPGRPTRRQSIRRLADRDPSAKKTQRLEKSLATAIEAMTQIVRQAWDEEREVEIWLREKMATGDEMHGPDAHNVTRSIEYQEKDKAEPVVEHNDDVGIATAQGVVPSVVPVDGRADSATDRADCAGAIGDGEWIMIRNGMALDPDSAAFVMPTEWLPGIPSSLRRGVAEANSSSELRVPRSRMMAGRELSSARRQAKATEHELSSREDSCVQ